jgi:hypothetical protein
VLFTHHPDQIFFRDSLSFEAQRSWGTVVALSGGVVSLGDPIRSLSPIELDAYRRFLPNLGARAVPIDLFEREYPEVWLTSLEDTPLGGAVIGLYSWGENRDHTRSPPAAIPEETRRHIIDLSALGIDGRRRAFELWTQSDLGVVDRSMTVEVPPRDSRVVVLRRIRDRPYLVASNRHVSQGATDLYAETWDERLGTLSWGQDVVFGFESAVHIDPHDRTSTPSVTSEGGAVEVQRSGALWTVRLRPARTGRIEVRASF